MTRRYALFGHPVAHSLSAAMHNAAFKRLGLDAHYELWDVPPEELAQRLQDAKQDLAGFNITVPHKQAVFNAADDVHDVGKQVGAINTVKVQDGRFRGRNTDVYGLQRACADERFAIEGAQVLVLGSGGAARASVVAAARARASSIFVAARDLGKAKLLSNELRPLFAGACSIEACALSEVDVFQNSSLVLQATSATLQKAGATNEKAESFAAELPLDALPAHACVMDLVYRPFTTTVMARAEARGLRTANGLGMLLHQGAAAFEWWTGEVAPVDFMREVLLSAAQDSAEC